MTPTATTLRIDPDPIVRSGLGWRMETPEGYVLLADYLKRRGDDIGGVLTVSSAEGHIHEATFKFGSLGQRQALAKVLARRVAGVGWEEVLEQFCVTIMRRGNRGDPFELIGGEAPEPTTIRWAVDDLVPADVLTWWFGARASVKSHLAALMAVCKTVEIPFLEHYTPQGKVGVLDWEDSKEQWTQYVEHIAAGFGIPPPKMHYKRCRLPLERMVEQIAREVENEAIDFLIYDSFGLAAGAHGERASWDEIAMTFAQAATEIGHTALVIDHISKASRRNPNREEVADPFGSQYKLALARAGYEIRKKQDLGSHDASVAIFDAKHERRKPLAVRVLWEDSRLTFEPEDVLGTAHAEALPLLTRCLHQLKRGSKSVSELSELLDATPAVLRKTLGRGANAGKVAKYPDDRWGLPALEIYRQPDL